MAKLQSAEALEELRANLSARDLGKRFVIVSAGTCGEAKGASRVLESIAREIEARGLRRQVVLKKTGCHGFCEREPMVLIRPSGICYLDVEPGDAAEIVSETILGRKVIDRLTYKDEATGKSFVHESEIPFYRDQMRVLIGDNTKLDPESIEDYIAIGGYSALSRALFEMTPDDVLQEIKKANLRGRGGGGFPAGTKWQTTRDAADPVKYVIVNADEGDPGAYMDRSLLEGNPHCVLEGLSIGAYAIGSRQGFIYVRQEYPLALENTLTAIAQAKDLGLLGENILGSQFSFDVHVHRGAGAFVSGESSALVTAIEGKTGEPRSKYARTAVKGLWGKPTNINNVETWANVPLIINRGADWFTSVGTEGSKGTKIFSLVGKVRNTGLVEVPMGATLREIIFNIGGGMKDGGKFKAVQTGGPSGGCLPESMLDLPVDFDELSKAGSMMGSGGMIVMDQDTCMVDVAQYFLRFLSEESCGKCIPCREGIAQMLEILERITRGEGREGDVEFLLDISELLSEASLCALGATAANPVLTTIKYFRDEYDAHIRDKCCPARVCKSLILYYIDPEKCGGCTRCMKECPADAIRGDSKLVHVIDQEKCIKCGRCLEVCPSRFRAVEKLSGVAVPESATELLQVMDEKG